MCSVPVSGVEPMSPALAHRFLTLGPPGMSKLKNLQSRSPLYFTLLILFTGLTLISFALTLEGIKDSWQLSVIWFCTD